ARRGGRSGPPQVDRADRAPCEGRAGFEPATPVEAEVAGEVVARPRGHDPEDAAVIGGRTGERVHRAVAAARGHASSLVERGTGETDRIVEVLGHSHVDVEVGGRERVGEAREELPGATSARGRVHNGGPAHGGRSYRPPGGRGDPRSSVPPGPPAAL